MQELTNTYGDPKLEDVIALLGGTVVRYFSTTINCRVMARRHIAVSDSIGRFTGALCRSPRARADAANRGGDRDFASACINGRLPDVQDPSCHRLRPLSPTVGSSNRYNSNATDRT